MPTEFLVGTGRPVFTGETVSHVLASVLNNAGSPAEQLQSRDSRLQGEVEKLQQQMQTAQLVAESKRGNLENAKVSIDATMAEIAELAATIQRMEEEIVPLPAIAYWHGNSGMRRGGWCGVRRSRWPTGELIANDLM